MAPKTRSATPAGGKPGSGGRATGTKAPAKTAKSGKTQQRSTLRERQRSLTRQALLDGALEVFSEKGYADVTIDEIAERAGTSRGTFYLYFTKGSVLAELIGNAFHVSIGSSTSTALLSEMRDAAPYTVDSLADFIRGYVSTWKKHQPIVRAWMEGDAIDPEVRAQTERRVARAVEVLTAVLVETREALGVPVDQEELRARATLMDLQLQYFCFYVIVRGLAVEVEAGIRAMAEQWYCAIFGVIESDGSVEIVTSD